MCALVLLVAVWLQGPAGLALVVLVVTVLVIVAVRAWVQPAQPLKTRAQSLIDPELVCAAMEQSPESMAVVDFEGALLYANQTFLQRSGYQLTEVIGRPAREISANGMSSVQRQQMRTTVEQGDIWRGVLNNRKKDGTEIQEGVSISPLLDAQGKVMGFVELKQDITELMQLREQLAQLLSFDSVTRLPNRWALSQQLEEILSEAEGFPIAPAYWHALVLLDMDGLSKFNAAHGVEWSDELLRSIAKTLQSLLPPNAWVSRTAGDEFAVILREAASSRNDARMMAYVLATQLQRGLASMTVYDQEDHLVQLTFCVGITVFPFTEPARKRDSEDHVYRRATMALYQAKALGPGNIHAFSEALEQSTQRKLAIEHGLYKALAEKHLHMYVQKQVDINGQVRGVEALLRWQPPGESLVSPGVFIPVAEESDLIVELGDWVLNEAVQLLNHPLVRDTSMWVAVNISARQFRQKDFVKKVAALVQAHNIAPGRLNLEVTENMVLTNIEETIDIMTRLNALGVQCALDDFGTGYSSLSYLHRLPIQEIKIDQSFIHNLEPDGKTGTLVQAVLMVAKSLELRVVAEGVEDEDQAALLRAWHPAVLCQGYLFSRPAPASDWLEELAQSGPSPQSASNSPIAP